MRKRAVDLSLEELAAMGAGAALAAAQRTHEAGLADGVPQGGHVSAPAQKLRELLATLEECHAALLLSGDEHTAHLLSLAISELRIGLNREDDGELNAHISKARESTV
jgi:hypothetical protein